ncbi:MAG TPA: ABC transporter permease [Archaeoglobus profundus]|nr:ABC transporter permease [Archaeoglobus profundus]HIP58252.1 ABC transporter permease [Archaeoglobus profundus]
MYLELAKRNILRTKVRSGLAIVGIIIGVMAISAIGLFGESLKATVLEKFKDLANEVIILPSYTSGYFSIDEETLKKVEKIRYVELIIPVKSTSNFIEYKNRRVFCTIYGMDHVDKLLTIADGSSKHCVVGYMLAKELNLRVGCKIRIGEKDFKVSGILKEEGARFDINPDNAVFLPLKDFNKLYNMKYSMIIVKIDMEYIEHFKDALDRIVNYKEKKVEAFELKIILDRLEDVFKRMTLFLIAIASVSLLVAGISILNTMLMATIERTREIGIMRAIGAYKETILYIFLTEAIVLGVIGSIIGSGLGLIGGYIINMLIIGSAKYIFTLPSLLYVFLGIVVGILTALVSALYPAWKASNLEPIEALRYE